MTWTPIQGTGIFISSRTNIERFPPFDSYNPKLRSWTTNVPVGMLPLVQLSDSSSSESLIEVLPWKDLKRHLDVTKTWLNAKIHQEDHIWSLKLKKKKRSRNHLEFLPVEKGMRRRDGTLVWNRRVKHNHASTSKTHFR